MSKHETPMTRWYWREVNKRKGLLIREFPAVEGGKGRSEGKRHIDGVIVCGRKSGDRKGRSSDRAMIKDKTVIVIQSKAKRLGMYLIGQTIVSRELMKSLGAKVRRSIALHRKNDPVMEEVLLRFKKCEAVRYTPGRKMSGARNGVRQVRG
jgi:hypothetical protein